MKKINLIELSDVYIEYISKRSSKSKRNCKRITLEQLKIFCRNNMKLDWSDSNEKN